MVLATMFTQKTTQSADLHRSREASRPGSIRLLILINPIFGHFDPRKRRPFPSDTRQPPSRISSNLIQLRLRNPHNTKKKTPRLCVSASKRHSPSRPLNHEMPNDPSPISGHSPTTRQTKSATHPRDSGARHKSDGVAVTRFSPRGNRGGSSSAAGLPVVFEGAAELAAAEGDDGIGATDTSRTV